MNWMTSKKTTTALTAFICVTVGTDTLRWGNLPGRLMGTTIMVMIAIAVYTAFIRNPQPEPKVPEGGMGTAISLAANALLSGMALLMAAVLLDRGIGAL